MDEEQVAGGQRLWSTDNHYTLCQVTRNVHKFNTTTTDYNYKLAKWLDEKLKPLSTNEHIIGDIFSFADDLQETEIRDHYILVSYDVSALFTNAPVDESIRTLARKVFKDDWFNKEYNLNITEADLIELLEVSTKNQLMANNFIQHGRRACELCHLLDLDLQTLSRTLQRAVWKFP